MCQFSSWLFCWDAVGLLFTLMQCNDFLLNVDIEVQASWLYCKCFITLSATPAIIITGVVVTSDKLSTVLLLLPATNYLLLLLPAVKYLLPHLSFLTELSATWQQCPTLFLVLSPFLLTDKLGKHSSAFVVVGLENWGCAAKAFYSCPAIISRRPESQKTPKEPQ